MASVLWEIIIPLLVAFAIGLLIGWMLWRWRRTKVTSTEWEQLTSSASKAEQRAATLRAERDSLSERVAALSTEVETGETAAGALRAELDAAEGKLGIVSSEQAQAAARLNELEKQLAAAGTRAEGLEQGQRDARARAAERDGEMAELRARAQTAAAEIAGLEAEIEASRAMAARLDAELADARRGASTVEGDLLTARARIEELEALVSSSPATTTAAVGFADAALAEQQRAAAAPAPLDDGEPDNLQLIDGVGPKLEQFLHEEGITTFAQLAALERAEIDALQEKLSEFPGRIEREQWVPQARGILSGSADVRVVPRSERDDLKRIKGVGPVLERWLHGRGIYRFVELAGLDATAVAELSSRLEDFPGRIEREEWVAQARELADHG